MAGEGDDELWQEKFKIIRFTTKPISYITQAAAINFI
jgi:hypothetical protein